MSDAGSGCTASMPGDLDAAGAVRQGSIPRQIPWRDMMPTRGAS